MPVIPAFADIDMSVIRDETRGLLVRFDTYLCAHYPWQRVLTPQLWRLHWRSRDMTPSTSRLILGVPSEQPVDVVHCAAAFYHRHDVTITARSELYGFVSAWQETLSVGDHYEQVRYIVGVTFEGDVYAMSRTRSGDVRATLTSAEDESVFCCGSVGEDMVYSMRTLMHQLHH